MPHKFEVSNIKLDNLSIVDIPRLRRPYCLVINVPYEHLIVAIDIEQAFSQFVSLQVQSILFNAKKI